MVTDAQSSEGCDQTLASSLVMMPQSSVSGGQGTPDLGSGVGSDTESVISIPSSLDEGVWEQVGTSVGGYERNVQTNDYVLVYDDRSSSSSSSSE